jgi:glycosyltransferase involved in cell wall biosynthesis
LTEGLGGHLDFLIVGHINLVPLGALIALLKRVPSLLIVYGADAWTPHRNVLVKPGIARFTTIAGISQLTLTRFAGWVGADTSRHRHLPCSVDLCTYTPGPKPTYLAEQLGLKDRTVLMTLGRLDSRERFKGFDEIIEVLPTLATHVPNISYLICGDGTDRDRLERKVRTLGLCDRVVFAGFVPEEQKPDYYRLADAYVMPSRAEGFGIVFLEALACGLPVMGSIADGGREALLDGALGCLVDPCNQIDVVRGVLETLSRSKGKLHEGLAQYSREAFEQRTRVIVRAALSGRC